MPCKAGSGDAIDEVHAREGNAAAVGVPMHCFRTLIEVLGTMTRNTCRVRSPDDGTPAVGFESAAQADERQRWALDLLKGIAGLSMPTPRLLAESVIRDQWEVLEKQPSTLQSTVKLQFNAPNNLAARHSGISHDR